MSERLFQMQHTLRALTTMIEAMMPEAQRLLDKGEEFEFHKVTGMLKRAAELETLIADAIVVETGNPNFGTGDEHTRWGEP